MKTRVIPPDPPTPEYELRVSRDELLYLLASTFRTGKDEATRYCLNQLNVKPVNHCDVLAMEIYRQLKDLYDLYNGS